MWLLLCTIWTFEFVVIVMKLGKTGNNLSNKNQQWPGQPDMRMGKTISVTETIEFFFYLRNN